MKCKSQVNYKERKKQREREREGEKGREGGKEGENGRGGENILMNGEIEAWDLPKSRTYLNELMVSRDHVDLGQTSVIIEDQLLSSHSFLKVIQHF